jgi:hypothetical protein
MPPNRTCRIKTKTIDNPLMSANNTAVISQH